MNSQKNVLFLETATNFAAYGLRVIHCLICNLRQVRESVFLCCELITTALLRLKQLLGETGTTKNYYTLIKHSYSGRFLQRCFGDISYSKSSKELPEKSYEYSKYKNISWYVLWSRVIQKCNFVVNMLLCRIKGTRSRIWPSVVLLPVKEKN